MYDLIQKYDSLKRATDLAIQKADFQHVAEEVLNRVVLETIKNYQARLSVGVEDSASDLLDAFKNNVTVAIIDTVSGWKIPQKEVVLFPRGCRFCYQKGRNTILVIENDPQVRSLCFDRSMLGPRYVSCEGVQRVALALPYVIFVLHFERQHFKNLYTGWCQHPLRSLDDMLYPPFLPNMHDSLCVCTGQMLELNPMDNLEEKSEHVIGTYWNSRFNNDLSEFWWKKSDFDPRLRSADTWVQASEEDPLFILSSRLMPNGKSLQYFLEWLTMHEQEPNENAMKHALSEEIDRCVEGLFVKISRYFKKSKFEKHYPKSVFDSLKSSIADVSKDLCDVILALDFSIREFRTEIPSNSASVLPVGPFWSEENDVD